MLQRALADPVDRPDCAHCAAARTDRAYCLFDATCLGCIARDLAQSPMAHKAETARDEQAGELMTAALQAAWGDRYAAGRQAVLDWMTTLRALRQP